MPSPSPNLATDTDNVANLFRWLADSEFRGYSPLYEHLARQIADELWICELITSHSRSPYAAVLFLDCVRLITLENPDLPLSHHYAAIVNGQNPLDPDPWPIFFAFVKERRDQLGTLLESHAIQTNEVGRSAALLPAFELVQREFGRPLGLIEIGCSAGLNLFLDRFRIDYGDAGSAGPTDSEVRLTCDVRGHLRPPIPDEPLAIASRLGIDIDPIDVTDPTATQWLEACIWIDRPERLSRLRSAIDLARREPPEVLRGNAVELIADAIAAIPDDVVACIDSTWVLAYLSADERSTLHAMLDEFGSRRSLAMVTAEYPGNVPWLPESIPPEPIVGHKAPTELGLGLWDHGRTEHRGLAWMQPHGQWLYWVDKSSASA
ncbi:MAG: DUF2332 domain-containing protein [Actinomycetes bacterium]